MTKSRRKAAEVQVVPAPAFVFASGATLERRVIAKHPAAWYFVERLKGTEAMTWIPDEVAERLIVALPPEAKS